MSAAYGRGYGRFGAENTNVDSQRPVDTRPAVEDRRADGTDMRTARFGANPAVPVVRPAIPFPTASADIAQGGHRSAAISASVPDQPDRASESTVLPENRSTPEFGAR
ncbi:hypothetical protein [Nocardia takedensis]|uniref:hypothetical protein n=1 Tax=Nocardia takedensis TaxID=259390 RepID=UPI0012F6AC1E|nr:hypothetical protein [Nocardia takedensis]